MIEAKEFRPGNYVNGLDGKTFEVIGVTKRGLWTDTHGSMNKDFNPIPLTEEWLLKFGFEKYEENKTLSYKMGKYALWEKTMMKNEWYFIISDGREWEHQWSATNENPLLYVHQLQNIFFDLAGKELEIK